MTSTLLPREFMSLESYERQREGLLAEGVAHRRERTVQVGPNAKVIFEDERTVRHQIQEMLHLQRISADADIQAGIDVYAPLIPSGSNLKATFMIEFPDAGDHRARVAKLIGVEKRVWMQTEGSSRIFGIADEDSDRAAAGETSAVHFLRFELEKVMLRDLKQGSRLSLGIDHPAYSAGLVLRDGVRRLLLNDLR
jgi:hypothetical protein